MTRKRWFLGLVALCALLVSASRGAPPPPQDPPGEKTCFRCKGTGKIPVDRPSLEQGVLHCSHYYRNDETGGVGFLVCDRCNDPEAQFEFDDRREVIRRWLESCSEFEKAAGIREGVLLETEYIRLFFALPSISFNRKRYDMHRGAHDYMDLLLRVFDEYRRIFGIESESPSPKHEIFIFDDRDSFSRFVKSVRGSSGMNIAGLKLRGNICWFITWRDPANTGRDELLRQKVVHNFGHLLIFKYRSRTHDLPTWLDVGFANYMEYLFYQDNRNTCFIEVPPASAWREGGGWKSRLKRDAIGKKQLVFADFHDKDLNAYDYRDMAYAFSYVDFFIENDIEKFRELVDRIKQGTGSLDAVREVYGWLPPELTEAWRGYVLKRY
jgi:hypothetical protein